MTNAVKMHLMGITLSYLFAFGTSTVWLHNAPKTFLGLAGAASSPASASSATKSYIVDLRRTEDKTSQLEGDKQLARQQELIDEEIENNGSGSNNGSDGANEASPSFFQKKVSKILTKLRLIAQIKNAYNINKNITQANHNLTFSITPNQNSSEKRDAEAIDDNINTESEIITTKSQNIQQIPPSTGYNIAMQSIPSSKNDLDEPVKIDLEVNRISNKIEELNTPKSQNIEDRSSRFGPLGVFFAELLGTVVGLTYGVVAQLTSGGQNPVVASTSGGL